MNKILVIAPHPDDEVLGCGAQIKKYSESEHNVYILVMTRGTPKYYSNRQIDNVRMEALAAHQLLGVTKTYFLDFHAPELDTYPLSEIAREIKKVIDEIQADIVYLPHRGDIHNDHGLVYKASLVACRPVGVYSVKRILAYETMSETEWSPPFGDDAFVPTVYSDVSQTFQAKLEAMCKFASQLRGFPNSRSLENLEALAKYRGATIGVERAEAFMLVRDIC